MQPMILRRLQRLHSDESGQVLWLFVISGLALVVLAALVFNSGKQATRRMEMQNAVDASAISGATWVARGMNVISMDNVAMTETLGIIANLRAIEQVLPINDEILSAEDEIASTLMSNPFTFAAGFVIKVGVFSGRISQSFMKGICKIACDAAHPTGGLLWKFMRALSAVSGVMTRFSYLIGAGQAYNLSIENIRGFRYEHRYIVAGDGAYFLPNPKTHYSLPAEAGSFQELCEPTWHGTNSSSPVATHGYTPLLGYAYGKGPFEKYKDWAVKGWSLSFITGIPWWYRGVADLNLEVFCHGSGQTPQLPKIPVRINDLDEARRKGAQEFVWLHSWVSTSEIEQDPDQPPPGNIDFEPRDYSLDEYNQQAKQLGESGLSAEELKRIAKEHAQQQTAAKPSFNDPVRADTYDSKILTEDANFTPPGTKIKNWVWAKQTTSSWTKVIPQQPPAQPITKIVYLIKEDRYTFQYATVNRSYDDKLKAARETGDPNDYPQPFHFAVDGQPLNSPGQLPQAVEALQYLTLAHKKNLDLPWLSKFKVSVEGKSRLVFKNPSQWGLFTYAQVQVYNPTSWDLYTQDWHAKLVRTTLIDQLLSGESQTGGNLPQDIGSLLQELNAH